MNQEITEKIESILDVSSKLYQVVNEDKETEVKNVVRFLNEKLNEAKLNELQIQYPRDTDRPINKIRALVADELLRKKQQKQLITVDDIEKIKTSVANEYDGQVLRSWGSYFKLLLPFFYNEKLRDELNDIANYLIEKTKLNGFVSIKVVDFLGPQSQGSPDAWLAIYNKEQKSHSDSWQFYIGFNNDVMKFGLYQHQNTEEKNMIIQKRSEINLDKIAEHLAYFSETIKNDIPSSQENSNSANEASNKHEKFPSNLNQILYGPPGTGKTYITAERAIEICDPEFTPVGNTAPEKRNSLMGKYKQLQNDRQISFVTFHQSYGYEEFVEGLRPVINQEDDDGQVRYEIRGGVFKKFCIRAAFEYYLEKIKESAANSNNVLEFSNLYDDYMDFVQSELEQGKSVELETKNKAKLSVKEISSQDNFILQHSDGARSYTVSKARLSKLRQGIQNIHEVTNLSERFRELIGGCNSSAYWAVLNAIEIYQKRSNTRKISTPPRDSYLFDEMKNAIEELNAEDYKKYAGVVKPYAIIIDEINRGNISKIFGELITLLEEDKREGKSNPLSVTLPYSQEKFSIPANVYVIGTMNTADRSLAQVDIALRRRFHFEEMMPNYEVLDDINVKGINVRKMLEIINKRIEALYDRDHTIGHAYFTGLTEIADEEKFKKLQEIFEFKVMPLLQEYFFDDWQKIKLVLGGAFVKETKIKVDELFGKGKETELEFLENKQTYSFNANTLADPKAYIAIYTTDSSTQNEPNQE